MKIKFTHWMEADGMFLGFLNDYPDHWTQGVDLDDLKDHLKDLHQLFSGDPVPGIRKVSELEIEAA